MAILFAGLPLSTKFIPVAIGLRIAVVCSCCIWSSTALSVLCSVCNQGTSLFKYKLKVWIVHFLRVNISQHTTRFSPLFARSKFTVWFDTCANNCAIICIALFESVLKFAPLTSAVWTCGFIANCCTDSAFLVLLVGLTCANAGAWDWIALITYAYKSVICIYI